MICGGEIAKKAAATMGITGSSRKSFIARSSAATAQAPTHALRVNVSTRATSSAGRIIAGHARFCGSKSSRATAAPTTSSSSPEYVM